MRDIIGEEVTTLKKEGKKGLVDLWAPWCGPCRTLIPRLEGLDTKYDNVEFVKVNVDEDQGFAQSLGIRSVPTVLIFNGDEEKARITGAQPESSYTEILDNL